MIVMPFTVAYADGGADAKTAIQVTDSGELHAAVSNAKDGDVIQLAANIAITTSNLSFDVANGEVTLDLNGFTLSRNGTDLTSSATLINVKSGSLIVDDTKGNGQILANETYTGKAGETAYTLRCVQVCGGAEFTLRGGTLENTNKDFNATQTISNYGTVNVESGTIKGVTGIFCFAPVLGSSAWSNQKAVCNISGGEILGTPAESYQGGYKDGYVGASYGVALYGPGYTSSGVDNDAVILNMDGGVIRAMQGIGTNASSGKYAGFTINMTDGLIDGTENGTGMYLPAMGVTNIYGGEVTGAQGIRICAGELNMTGGTLTGTALSDNSDLVAGGSGGTNGALVAGKASNGYVGNIDISISGDAVIRNTASGSGVQPTIVVSDKNMASTASQEIKDKNGDKISDYSYSGTSISVSVDGAAIEGDVVKISNLTPTTTPDGGDTTLQLHNASVSGSVINQTSETSLSVDGGSIGGDVKNIGKGSISMQKTSVTGSVVNSNAGAVTVVESTVQGSVENPGSSQSGTVTLIGTNVKGETSNSGVTVLSSVTDDQIVSSNGKTYGSDELGEALSDLPAGGTLYLGKGTFQLSSAVTIDKSVTLRGRGAENTIIQGVSTDPTVYFTVKKGNVVFDGMTFEDFGGNHRVGSGTAVIKVPSGSDVNTNLTVKNAVFENFNRAAIDIEAGKYAISGCSIDCNNEYSETSEQGVLTKGIKIGYGITEASGTIDNVQISSSASTYKKWSASAIEVYQNGSAVITNTEINDCLTGIWVDSYYNAQNDSGNTGTSAYVELGENVNISPKEGGDALIVAHQAKEGLRSSVHITDGEYDGPVYIIEYTPNGETEYAENTEDNFIRISGGRFHNLTPEGMGEDISYIADGYHMDSNGNIKKDTSSPSSSSSSDDPGSALPLAPGASYQPGEPSDSTQPGASGGFVSDTTNDLTVNGTYQFRITSLDGTIPFLTVDNANFRVEFASQEGNDFFFKIHAQGAAGSTTVVSVNGVRLLTATVGGSATGVISDTTAPFTVKKGETYQFRLTASERPSFAAGSASFTVEYAGQIGSDYFYKVYAAGNVGDGCGFYINGEASPVAVATIA